MAIFSRDGLHFDYRDEGPSDGPVVLLLHGFPQDSTAWDAVVEPLHDLGYRTLAPDMRGYSTQAMPRARSAYRHATLVADQIGLLDHVGVDRAHVVGHDWGGFIAWLLASEHPDRIRTITSLATPHPSAYSRVLLRSSQAVRSFYMGVLMLPHLGEAALAESAPLWRALAQGLPPHQAHHYAQRLERPGAKRAATNWYRVLPGELVRPSVSVHRITIPALYLWGMHEKALSRAAAEATAEMVTGEYTFVELAEAGHWLPERHPEEIVARLRTFLGAHAD